VVAPLQRGPGARRLRALKSANGAALASRELVLQLQKSVAL
jgi:hypothetical protein